LTDRKKLLTCPKCGFVFDVTYGRSFACAGCPSVIHCDYAKCPQCGHEFPTHPELQLKL